MQQQRRSGREFPLLRLTTLPPSRTGLAPAPLVSGFVSVARGFANPAHRGRIPVLDTQDPLMPLITLSLATVDVSLINTSPERPALLDWFAITFGSFGGFLALLAIVLLVWRWCMSAKTNARENLGYVARMFGVFAAIALAIAAASTVVKMAKLDNSQYSNTVTSEVERNIARQYLDVDLTDHDFERLGDTADGQSIITDHGHEVRVERIETDGNWFARLTLIRE